MEYDDYGSYDYDDYPSNDIESIFNDSYSDNDLSKPSPSFDSPVSDSNYKIADNDPSIILNHNLSQTKTFLREHLNIHISSLRGSNVPGLVILRLQDLNLIREDTRCKRVTPNILFLSIPGSTIKHPDLSTALSVLNK